MGAGAGSASGAPSMPNAGPAPSPGGQPQPGPGQVQPHVGPAPETAGAPQDAPGEARDWLITLLLAIFLGGLGVHRFYTGHILVGVIQLLTMGGCGIWAIIDIISIATDSFRDADGQPLVRKN